MNTPRLVVMVSGSGTNLQAIMDSVAEGQIDAELVAVISDRPDAFGLERARRANIPDICVNFDSFPDRAAFDQQLAQSVAEQDADVIALAGFMRILSAELVNQHQGKMLNVHPSLLPKYPGLNTYDRVLEAGDAWHGSTVHFVTPELDAGPTVIQYRVAVHPEETAGSLCQRVQAGEYLIYPQAISWLAAEDLQLRDRKPYLKGQALIEPVQVYEQIAEETG